MSTTPTIPAAPAAASTPAAAPSAPVSTPTPAPAAATSTPSAPAPAPATPSATSAPASSAPQGPQPPAKLNPSEYANASDAYMAEAAWRQQMEAFKAENPTVEIGDDSPWPTEKPAEAPAEGEQPQAEAKPEEGTQENPQEAGEITETFSFDDDPALTPQAMNDLIKNDDALRAALEANPAAKNQLFKMAREHAELAQFKGIFPTADSAKFARETANRTVSLRATFQQAETPEQMAGAFDRFVQEFAVMDPATGKQAVDEQGNPVYGDDLYMFGEHVVERYADNTLEEVEARLAANQYRSEEERERDSDLQLALKIIKGDLRPTSNSSDPDLSEVPEHLRADIQRRLDDVKAREAALDAQRNGATKEQRAAQRSEGNKKFMEQSVKRTFDQVQSTIDTLRKAGAVIPDWMLKTTAPGSTTPIFYMEVGKEIANLIGGDPYTRNVFTELEMRPPTPENIQARVEAYDRLLQQADERGNSNLRRIVVKLVRAFGKDMQMQQAAKANPATTAAPEPRSSAAPAPKVLTQDDAYRMAEQQLAKEVHGWNNLSPSEKMAYTMTRQSVLLQSKR